MARSNHDEEKPASMNGGSSVEDLRNKYANLSVSDTTRMIPEEKSPKKIKKSKVKQIASMFNNKLSQLIKRDMGGYLKLVNELSPEPILPRPNFLKPMPMARKHLNKLRTPIPTPRNNKIAKVEENSSACFVPEDIFAQLSVKEKAKLYTQFVEEMTKKNPKFGVIEGKTRKIFKSGEIVIEKQATVKDLLEELEFKRVFPIANNKPQNALQRMDSMRKACAARKQFQSQQFGETVHKAKSNNQLQKKSLMPQQDIASKTKSYPELEQNHPNDSIFQNQPMEDLFFSWFKEKHGGNKGNEMMYGDEKRTPKIDTLLEETIAKLETREAKENSESPKAATTSSVMSLEAEESESGVSSLTKSGGEESLSESCTIPTNRENNFEFAQPIKSSRKRKIRKKAEAEQEILLVMSTDSEPECNQVELKAFESCDNFQQMDSSLMRLINSPRKIKSAYTLTVNDLDTPLCTPRPSINFIKQMQPKRASGAANDANSPPKRTPMETKTEKSLSTPSTILNSSKGKFDNSTPLQSQEHRHSFTGKSSAEQLFSPIAKPIKNRRKSLYDIESQRNSLITQVIQEDQPFHFKETRPSCFYPPKGQNLSANSANTNETPKNTSLAGHPEKNSQFWIICGDFSMILDIDYITSERLRLLYEIFSRTSSDTKELHFGIDNYKFSVHDPLDLHKPTRIPATKGSSHYWFSTGDLAIPFSGKCLAPQKIQRIFHVIKETVEESGILRFGVDDIEFSNVAEFWHQPAKFSVDSQYSMLVGLQTGDSNGLEGRSKYSWPHSKSVQITDLDQTDNLSDGYKDMECSRLSCAGTNYYDLSTLDYDELSMPRCSSVMTNIDDFCFKYESEPLDQIFNGGYTAQSEPNELKPTQHMSVNEMIHTFQNEKQRLSAVQTKLSNYVKPSFITKDALDAYKGTPEYIEKLKTIIMDINKIGCSNYLKDCSVDELDSYMYFLSRYAEVCLSSCSNHIEKVLDALGGSKEVLI